MKNESFLKLVLKNGRIEVEVVPNLIVETATKTHKIDLTKISSSAKIKKAIFQTAYENFYRKEEERENIA